MTSTKYKEERTLVRGLHRLPGEDRDSFRLKTDRLRKHFQQFNLDVSELCQWLMSLRPKETGQSSDFRRFWDSVLDPESALQDSQRNRSDWFRLTLVKAALGLIPADLPDDWSVSLSLAQAINEVRSLRITKSTAALKVRAEQLNDAHFMIICKSAAEWIMQRYVRVNENQARQLEEWTKEKAEWESRHPELTEELRNTYNHIFRELGIRRKKPRVCTWEHLSKQRDNCEWAGKRLMSGGKWQNHAQLCVKYRDFEGKIDKGKKTYFTENAKSYLAIRKRNRSLKRNEALENLYKSVPKARGWFGREWERYLKVTGLSEQTLLADQSGRLPHCVEFGEEFECAYNRHTNECEQYRRLVSALPSSAQDAESLYREWRREYLAGPRRAVFRYPSAQNLPLPKIFGRGFYTIEFTNSVLRLRLDDMPDGEFLDFGFKPWPRGYDFQPEGIEITSVHVHFIGTRARVGFRFSVPHKASRLGISQDEIDRLRSYNFPRKAQDQKFLDEVRKQIIANLSGCPEGDLRILTVDLGTEKSGAAVFKGREFVSSFVLKTVKLDNLYETRPSPPKDSQGKQKLPDKKLGLGPGHVGRHLTALAESFQKISATRIEKKADERAIDAPPTGAYDERRFVAHIRWMIRDWVRLNASQIICKAEKEKTDIIVFESMRGFRAPGYDRIDDDKKRRLAFFAFGRVRRKVAEKAVERGMRVVTVPYLFSSQVCSSCGRMQKDKATLRQNKGKGNFKCENVSCSYSGDSDANAAAVLGHVFWGKITLPADHLRNKT
jgi:hypothetical protein